MHFELPSWAINTLFPVVRWAHMVASALLVGGVLFFEFVVPLATSDLGPEQQFAVFGRARWVFRRVVSVSAALLILTGAFSVWRMWHLYVGDEPTAGGVLYGSRPWVAGHVALGLLAFAMALRVTRTSRVAPRPVGWLRAVLVVLMVSIFLASVARHVRLRVREWRDHPDAPPHMGAV